MKLNKKLFLLLLLFFFTCISNTAKAEDKNKEMLPQNVSLKSENLIIDTKFIREGILTFHDKSTKKIITQIDIEIADNPDKIGTGLMYRRSLPDKAGVLFIFKRPQPLSFWMKNTYIPLDIIFVDENMQIVTIYKNTKPLSEDSIPSYRDSLYVIEVNAGFCDKYGIQIEDYIKFLLKTAYIESITPGTSIKHISTLNDQYPDVMK